MKPLDVIVLADGTQCPKALARTLGIVLGIARIQCVDPADGHACAREAVEDWKYGSGPRKLCIWHVEVGASGAAQARKFFNEHLVVLHVLGEPIVHGRGRRIVLCGRPRAMRRLWLAELIADGRLADVTICDADKIVSSILSMRYAEGDQVHGTLSMSAALQCEFAHSYFGSASEFMHRSDNGTGAEMRSRIAELNSFLRDKRLAAAEQTSDLSIIKEMLAEFVRNPFQPRE